MIKLPKAGRIASPRQARAPTRAIAALRALLLALLCGNAAAYDPGAGDGSVEASEAYAFIQKQEYVFAFPKADISASKGNARGMQMLGWLHHEGHGTPKNYQLAEQWYERAAAKGSVVAMFNLGLMHEYGNGVPADEAQARAWLRKAADGGYALATSALGVLDQPGGPAFRRAMHVEAAKNYTQAAQLYKQAAGLGQAKAALYLADMNHKGIGMPKDMAAARRWYQRASDLGDADATTKIGWLYYSGEGGEKNFAEALRWYLKGAEQGSAAAMYNVGVVYANGDGVPADPGLARQWYQKAADKGEKNAIAKLARMPPAAPALQQAAQTASQPAAGEAEYQQGLKFHFGDKAKAFEWYTKAAALGHPQATINVAEAYLTGAGAPKDLARSRQLYGQAAAAGSAYASMVYADFLLNGNGGEQDIAGGIAALERAAYQGSGSGTTNQDAMGRLFQLYDEGKRVPRDMVQANYWLQLSASKGNIIAINTMKARGLIQKPADQQAFIDRIDREGPSTRDLASFNYDVGVYCQYEGPRCHYWRGQYQRMEKNWNDRAATQNQQRLWNVYSRPPPAASGGTPCSAASGCYGAQQQRYEWEKQLNRQ